MGIIYMTDGRFLIAQRPEHKMFGGLWEFPGGKINDSESAENALIRELDEELELTISIDQKLDEYFYTDKNMKIKFIPFKGSLTNDKITIKEHQNISFIYPDEMINYQFAPPDYKIVEHLNNEIKMNLNIPSINQKQ
jgi:mutator protein MutT